MGLRELKAILLILCVFYVSSPAADTLELVKRIPHSGYSEGLAVFKGRLWHALPKVLLSIDPATGIVESRHQPATEYSESLTWFKGKLFNVSFKDNGIYRSNGKVPLKFVRVGTTPEQHAWGMTHNGRELVLTGHYSSQLYFLNPDTLKVVRQITVPIKDLEDLAWDGQGLWTSSFTQHRGHIFRVDPKTGAVQKMYRLPDPEDCPIVDGIAYQKGQLWVTGKNCPSIWVFKKPSERAISSKPSKK